jgi:3-hydroxyisobutyrate dehydrogenase-like beta-hydroxyacid dehydrogenase
MSAQTLGFVGVGRMGGPMAMRLLDAGHSLVIYDTSQEALGPLAARGATVATSAADVASKAEVVFLSLPTPPIVQAVVTGEAGVLQGSMLKALVDLSTTGPSVAAVCAKAAAVKGVAWMDSPVSGGITGATKGTLAVMVSGPKATYDRLDEVLKVFGKLFYVGEKPGLAQVAKLANNLLAAAALVLSSEAVVMGVKAGIDPKVLIDIINAGSGRNSATQDKFPRAVLTRTFDFGFATGLSYKDVRLCLEEAEALGVPMVAGAAVRQMLAITQAKFGFDSDFTCIAKVVEEWAGVEIKG